MEDDSEQLLEVGEEGSVVEREALIIVELNCRVMGSYNFPSVVVDYVKAMAWN